MVKIIDSGLVLTPSSYVIASYAVIHKLSKVALNLFPYLHTEMILCLLRMVVIIALHNMFKVLRRVLSYCKVFSPCPSFFFFFFFLNNISFCSWYYSCQEPDLKRGQAFGGILFSEITKPSQSFSGSGCANWAERQCSKILVCYYT